MRAGIYIHESEAASGACVNEKKLVKLEIFSHASYYIILPGGQALAIFSPARALAGSARMIEKSNEMVIVYVRQLHVNK